MFSKQESLEALETLPEATLFDESSVSSVWLDVVERSQKFLTSVVLSQVSGGGKGLIDIFCLKSKAVVLCVFFIICLVS